MKKITLFSVYLLLALAIFAPKVCASEEDLNYLKNTMNSITKEKILLEGPLYDENQPLYELDNRIMRGEFFDATVDINESSCDSTKCKVVLTKGDVSYTQTDVKYYVSGIVSNVKDSMIFNIGDTLTINAKLFESDGITQYKEAVFSYYIDGLAFTNNSVKFTKPGIYEGYVEATSKEGELLRQYFSLVVNFQDYINFKLEGINALSIDMSDFGTVEMIFSNTLKEKIFNNFSYGSSNESTCEDNTCNVKINIYLGEDNEFKIEKDNIKINRIGISIDSFGYADINIGENYTPTFRSYSGDVTWSSSDSSIAKVDANTGVVTAVASGAVLITGKTSDNMKNSYVLRVKPNDAYKSKFQSDFNEIMKDRDTIVLPAISSLEVDNNDYIYMLINTEINKLIKNYDKKYVMHVKETSAGKVTIEMGSTYEFNTIDEYQSVEYCQTYDESNGFNCGSTTKELTIKYADQVSGSGYDSTLVNPAKEVLKQLKKKYVVNMNISFKDYLNHPEFVDNYDFVKDANIGKLLNNPKGFEIGIDGRAGDSSFENALVNGYPLVIKNGITYASSEEPFTISRTLVVNGKANDSEENKIANIKATVLKTLDSTDKVDVKRNEDGTYNIVITKNSINSTSQNLLNSNYTVKSLLTTVNSNSVRYLASEGNSIEFNTYVSFKTVSTKPSIAKLSISKGNNNSLKLTWNSVDGATKYYIYRSTNKSSGYKKIKVVTTNEYINTGLTYGKTYYYKIVSANSNGSSKYSNIVAKKVVPNKVENLKYVSSTDSYIKLSFNKVNTTGYELYRSTNNKTWTKVATLTKNNILTYVNKKLRANKNYYYKVRAYKTVSGRKIYGSFSTTVKMLTAPSVPKIKVSLKSYKSLNIKIYESTSASKYLVYRSTSKTGKYSLVKELTTFGSFVEDDLVTGSTYYYKVRSCNIFDSCSSYSSAVSKKVTPGVPTFSVYAVDKKLNQIGISLIDGVNGFEVYRSTKKTSGYKKIFDVPIEVSLNPAISGKSGVTYYFKLRSYKTVNGKKVYSSFSSYKKVKTK